MALEFLFERFRAAGDKDAIIWRDKAFTYGWLLERTGEMREVLRKGEVPAGGIVGVRSDFNPDSVALLLALIENANVIVPISHAVTTVEEFLSIAEAGWLIELKDGTPEVRKREQAVSHALLKKLRQDGRPGLVLFSSGSTGRSKAALHDFIPLLEKFKVVRPSFRTMTFLLFDHIGGVNTLLSILSNTGLIVSVEDRQPEAVCRSIERHKVELLPTSPTFINLLLMSRAYDRHDISSLKLVTYGTEVMPVQTLLSFRKLFPDIRLKQTYGLSELGILRSKSRDSTSLWVKVGGEGFQTKVVDDILFIKAATAMLGYLNHPSPFDEDGWFDTQDRVEVDGEWIRILGRVTDIINVGGQKVYPAEVESVLMELDNISEAAVFPRHNPILGSVVAARLSLREEEPLSALKKRVRKHCGARLEEFKVPIHIEISDKALVSPRYKRVR